MPGGQLDRLLTVGALGHHGEAPAGAQAGHDHLPHLGDVVDHDDLGRLGQLGLLLGHRMGTVPGLLPAGARPGFKG